MNIITNSKNPNALEVSVNAILLSELLGAVTEMTEVLNLKTKHGLLLTLLVDTKKEVDTIIFNHQNKQV